MIDRSVIPEPHYIPAMRPLPSSMIFSCICLYTCCYLSTMPPFCPVSYLKTLSKFQLQYHLLREAQAEFFQQFLPLLFAFFLSILSFEAFITGHCSYADSPSG